MNKPASCRAVLETALPHLAQNPDRLVMFIEQGHIASSLGGPGFEYKYTLIIGLLDFNQHPDTIMLPLLQWLKTHQPALLQNPDTAREAISFEAEILNHDSYDLRLQIKLSERVKVTLQGHDYTADHLPEPQLGEYPTVERVQIFDNGELIDDSTTI